MPRKITKIIALFLCFFLVFEQSGFAQVASQLDISSHFLPLSSSFNQDKFRPLHLRYLDYDSQKNNFKLLLDKGDLKDLKTNLVQDSTRKLMEYFFVGLVLPNDSFWVNLRPDSPGNVIDPFLAQTDVGKILLEADLQLKKDTARMTSPETREGREYWSKLYKKAEEILGYDNVIIPTLTRPWIVPGEIIIRETPANAYIYKANLKVMLEQDYLKDSAVYKFDDPRLKVLNEYASQLIRELIIPKLTKEINVSKRYASLRQVYYSLILAQWFKQRFKGLSPQGAVPYHMDSRDLTNLISKESWSKDTYFKEYQKSFKDGEYNLQEPVRTPLGQSVRSYMSGGIGFGQEITSSINRDLLSTSRMLPDNLAKTNIALEYSKDKISITYIPILSPSDNLGILGTSGKAAQGQGEASASSPLNVEEKTSILLNKIEQKDPSQTVNVITPYSGPQGNFVSPGRFKVAPINVPLATAGVATCAALVVIDKQKGLHYLAHVTSEISMEQILSSLQGFDLENSQVYIMEGILKSETLRHIVAALIDKVIIDKVKFLSPSGDRLGGTGITAYNGELYLQPQRWIDWKTATDQFINVPMGDKSFDASSPLSIEEIAKKSPEEITAEDKSVILDEARKLNFYIKDINEEKDKKELTIYAMALSLLRKYSISPPSGANLSLGDYTDIDLKNLGHELGHIPNTFDTIKELFSDIDELAPLMQEFPRYRQERSMWITILGWDKLFNLNSGSVIKIFDGIIQYIQETRQVRQGIEDYLRKHVKELDLSLVEAYFEGALQIDPESELNITTLDEMKSELDAPGRKEITNINDSIKKVVETYKNSLRTRIDFELNLDENAIYIFGNALRLRYVWQNLIGNAVYEMNRFFPVGGDKKGIMRISSKKISIGGKDSIEIIFENNGKTISQDLLDRRKIFELGVTEKKGGTGTGLFLCDTVIKDHQGVINVDPQFRDGARFVISLPLSDNVNNAVSSPIEAAQAVALSLLELIRPALVSIRSEMEKEKPDFTIIEQAGKNIVSIIRANSGISRPLTITLTQGGILRQTDMINTLSSVIMGAQLIGLNLKTYSQQKEPIRKALLRFEEIMQRLSQTDKFSLTKLPSGEVYVVLPSLAPSLVGLDNRLAYQLADSINKALGGTKLEKAFPAPVVNIAAGKQYAVEYDRSDDVRFDRYARVVRLGPLVFVVLNQSKVPQSAIDLNEEIRELKVRLNKKSELYRVYAGNVFFITPTYYDQTSHRPLSHFILPVIGAMLANSEKFKDAVVFDLGAGDGLLARIALRLGAQRVVLVEQDKASIDRARLLLAEDGWGNEAEIAKRVAIIQEDLTSDSAKIKELFNTHLLDNRQAIGLINIGPAYHAADGKDPNYSALKIVSSLPGINLVINGGHFVSRDLEDKLGDEETRLYEEDRANAHTILKQAGLFVSEVIYDVAAGVLIGERISSGIASSPATEKKDDKGGIDFRALPIFTQPAATTVAGANLKVSPLAARADFRPDAEWQAIQKMLDAGIIPSAQRVKEYLENCCSQDDYDRQMDKVLSSVADILRLEEGQVLPTEAAFKEILIALESNRPSGQMKSVLSNIIVVAVAPKAIKP